jgi:hypothetical protein
MCDSTNPTLGEMQMNSSDQTTHGEEQAEEDAIEIQRLLAWYFRTEDPSRHSAVGDLRDAA